MTILDELHDDNFDKFQRALALTPLEVSELDWTSESQLLSAAAEIKGIPEEVDRQLPPDLLIAARVDSLAADDVDYLDSDQPTYTDHGELVKAIGFYSRVAQVRTSQAGPGSPRVLAVLAKIAELNMAAGNLERARHLYTEIQRHDPSGRFEEAANAVEALRGRVRESAGRATHFQDWIDKKRRIAHQVPASVDELTSEAVDNPAAARLRVLEGGALAAPLPVSQISEAVLESGLGMRLERSDRGREWREPYAHLVIIQSPLTHADHPDQHLEAVLNQPYGKAGATVGDAIFAAGAFPESSDVLLKQLTAQYNLTDRDVVIHCPYFLRNRADRDPRDQTEEERRGDLDRTTPHDSLAGVVVTSLGWGGAANVGALLARWWGWGFTAAAQANLAGLNGPYAFGDWSQSLRYNRRHSELASRLIDESRDLLFALRSLTQRVVALDHPIGALQALKDLTPEPSPNPLALVMVTMDPRRVRFVAKHMLSKGGRYLDVPDNDAEALSEELLAVQHSLSEVIGSYRSSLPVVIVELHDHLEDGYAESTEPVDPVDPDFDAFYDTAIEVHEHLTKQLPGLTVAPKAAHD